MRALLVALVLAPSFAWAAPRPLPAPKSEDEASRRYDDARAAYKAGDYQDAALAFDAASTWFKDPVLLWNAGRAWERAGELVLAKRRFERYLAIETLSASERADGEKALAHVEAQMPSDPGPVEPPPADAPILGWALVGGGGALAVAGVVLSAVGQGELDSISEAQDGSLGGVVVDITRREALDRKDSGTTLRTVGLVTTGLGVATAVGGLVLVLTHDSRDYEGHTGVTLAPRPGGFDLGWATRF